MARVIFDPAAKPHLLHHLEIELRPHADALGLEKFPVALERRHALFEFLADARGTDDVAIFVGVAKVL